MNFEELERKIEAATKKAFIEIYDQHQDEGIYGFALYSDGGAMTVCPSANTQDFLEDLDDEEKEDLVYYKFEPAEWKYEMVGADEAFNDISKELRTELGENRFEDEATFVSFRKSLFSTCINVLKKLKGENFFKNITGEEVFLTFTVSDYEFENKEVEDIIIQLNDNDYQTEYLEWMKSWAD